MNNISLKLIDSLKLTTIIIIESPVIPRIGESIAFKKRSFHVMDIAHVYTNTNKLKVIVYVKET
jgi:hypothetical protein